MCKFWALYLVSEWRFMLSNLWGRLELWRSFKTVVDIVGVMWYKCDVNNVVIVTLSNHMRCMSLSASVLSWLCAPDESIHSLFHWFNEEFMCYVPPYCVWKRTLSWIAEYWSILALCDMKVYWGIAWQNFCKVNCILSWCHHHVGINRVCHHVVIGIGYRL